MAESANAAAPGSKQNTLLPEQEKIFYQMVEIMSDSTKEMNGEKGFLSVHHGSYVPLPDEYSLVYEKIYMGGEKMARDIESLKSKGITHVVNCAQGRKFSQVDTSADFYKESGIHYMGISGHDSIKFDISIHFDKTAAFIEEGCQKGCVYVHCHQGISRSATIVIAYLMIKQKMTAPDALKEILKHRIVRPNNGFLKRLAFLQSKIS